MRLRGEVGDMIVAVALIALAALFFLEGRKLAGLSGPGIGASDFPQGLAALLAAAALLMILVAAGRVLARRPGHLIEVRRPLRVLAGMVLLAAFPVLMERAGYYIAMGVFFAAFLWVADYRRPVGIVVAVCAFLAASWLVFAQLLKIPLP